MIQITQKAANWLMTLAIVTVCITGCADLSPSAASHSKAQQDKVPTIVIENVNVISMTLNGEVRLDATVIIEDQRIAALEGPAPSAARRIDGHGKWLIPGLTDMHVHVPAAAHLQPKTYPTQSPSVFFDTQDIMTPYIANGVTTIFNVIAEPRSFGQRNLIEKGAVVGPHMALAAMIDGGDSSGRVANSPSDGRQSVRDAKAEGYEFIKVYSGLDPDTYAAIIDEAGIQGLKTVGHIPDSFRGKLEQAFVPGFDLVAHAEEYSKHSEQFSHSDAERFAQLAKANNTWLTPTLTTMEWIVSQAHSLDELRELPSLQYVHPLLQSKWLDASGYHDRFSPERIKELEQMLEFHRMLVQAFKAADVPIMAGTDTLTSGVVAGFALHDELGLLVEAGLTHEEALAAATRLPAEWLGVDSDRGTIEVGKRADLILLDANPLLDIHNTRKIAGVFINGQWLDRATLDAMLADLSQRNTARMDQFDWNELTN